MNIEEALEKLKGYPHQWTCSASDMLVHNKKLGTLRHVYLILDDLCVHASSFGDAFISLSYKLADKNEILFRKFDTEKP